MRSPQAPRLERRRAKEFSAELQERAGAWIPSWGVTDSEGDFGRALLEIAARFSSEVAECLDGAGEKMRRGFLDWLAVRGRAARPARMPVVLKLADTARDAVLAGSPVRLQADAGGTPVVFETEEDVRLIPGTLEVVVGVDADNDAFFLPPPGLSDLEPLESLPTRWQLKSFAASGSNKLQLDPEAGLAIEMIIEAAGNEYRIVKVDNEIITFEPPLEAGLPAGTTVRKVVDFAPFDLATRNRQEHALYLGHLDLLNIEAAATIDVVGAISLRNGYTWEYWGKRDGEDEVGWQRLRFDDERQQSVNDAIALAKDKGAVETREIGGKKSRWIRAFRKTVDDMQPSLQVDRLQLRVNCKAPLKCGSAKEQTDASPEAEAMANTTPLVLDSAFFPLGKEPRQFDAFYLGSEEAFSKKGADVQLCFDMADRTMSTISSVSDGSSANYVLAGVAKDRSLHLLSFDPNTRSIGEFRDRGPLQPPQPSFAGSGPEGNKIALDAQPKWRLPMWSEGDNASPPAGFVVATSAGDAIWLWHEHSVTKSISGWVDFGKLPSFGNTPNPPIDGLVYLRGVPALLVALVGDRLFKRQWPPDATDWTLVPTKNGNTIIKLKSIVPVLIEDASKLVTSSAAGMIGIDVDGKLFNVDVGGTCTPRLGTFTFDTEIRPTAVNVGAVQNVAAVTKGPSPKLVANNGATTKEVPVDQGKEVLVALEAMLVATTFHVIATFRNSGGSVITWAPFGVGSADSIFRSFVALAQGAPSVVGKFVVVPGSRADLLVSDFDIGRRKLLKADIEIGLVMPGPTSASLGKNDLIVRFKNGKPVSQKIKDDRISKEGAAFFEIASAFADEEDGPDVYDLQAKLAGTFNDPELTLDPTDKVTDAGDWLRIDDEFYEVDTVISSNGDRIATLNVPNHNHETPTNGKYVRPNRDGRFAPFMKLNTSDEENGAWDADLLRRITLFFPDGLPTSAQRAVAFAVEPTNNRPKLVVMGEEFEPPLGNNAKFWVDGFFGEWRRIGSDTSANPELSWEYWNGTGWWNLNIDTDETQHMKMSGAVEFEIPDDIDSSDWAGKKNFWIRARLVGGDYGQAEVKVVTRVNPDTKEPEQIVERSTDKIRAPQVLELDISYRICDEVLPEFVLAQDSGTIRDQSDANQTPNAIVEAFVPLRVLLGRLSKTSADTEATEGCASGCGCLGQQDAAISEAATTAAADGVSEAAPPMGRSIFLGLNATPSEGPVNVLFLVDEKKHSAFAPMEIDALLADRLDAIVAQDETRALGETGLLSMAFAVPPTRSELFGRENLTWLRLSPKANPSAEWLPTLRGAYLNAAWASATETLTRELLGSSNGEPDLTVRVARPPVLYKTIELRVREPLGDEERDELLKKDKDSVLSAVEGLPGDWVLWTQVVDADDEAASARVYAFDENTGEIRFGDGRHGKIPPIGRDSIVAFRYSRTEPDPTGADKVPGNTIVPRTQLNLVSPVESVERVVSADQAAGGAPPESDERVLRFGFARLRHRDRAVTASDIEDLALQSSPDIVQARAFVRRAYIRLVVVMAGKNPQPNGSQIRELRRLLLASAPASLSAPGALVIEGPAVRRLRVELDLRIDRLDFAGDVTAFAKTQIASFFDTATGGADDDGWALGLSPNEGDIALALIDAPHLESIKKVKLVDVTGDGESRPWASAIKATELVMPADDGVRIQFETAEVLV